MTIDTKEKNIGLFLRIILCFIGASIATYTSYILGQLFGNSTTESMLGWFILMCFFNHFFTLFLHE